MARFVGDMCPGPAVVPAFPGDPVRYKGQRTPAQNEREFRHIVELAVPPGGFRARLDEMYAFHASHGLEPRRGRGQRRGDQDFVRWCFAGRSHAEAFATAFGGKLIK